jgi:hypothetical protein
LFTERRRTHVATFTIVAFNADAATCVVTFATTAFATLLRLTGPRSLARPVTARCRAHISKEAARPVRATEAEAAGEATTPATAFAIGLRP